MAAVKQAVKIGVRNIIGVKREYAQKAFEHVKGTGIKFYPYVGRVIGIPEVLEGTIEEMIMDAKSFRKMGVDGINLLAYRYKGDPEELMKAVISNAEMDVIVAGSIDSFEKIRKVITLGATLYTIGGAIFEKRFIPGGSIADQVKAIIEFEKTF